MDLPLYLTSLFSFSGCYPQENWIIIQLFTTHSSLDYKDKGTTSESIFPYAYSLFIGITLISHSSVHTHTPIISLVYTNPISTHRLHFCNGDDLCISSYKQHAYHSASLGFFYQYLICSTVRMFLRIAWHNSTSDNGCRETGPIWIKYSSISYLQGNLQSLGICLMHVK